MARPYSPDLRLCVIRAYQNQQDLRSTAIYSVFLIIILIFTLQLVPFRKS
jgi:hypothetical protein